MTSAKHLRIAALALCLSAPLPFATAVAAEAAPGTARPTVEDACSGQESWSFGALLDDSAVKDFRLLTTRRQKPVLGFSQGLALRRFGQNDTEKLFGEYWISRALFEAKLMHVAFNGFASIAMRPLTPSSLAVQTAALACMLEIESLHPSLSLPASVTQQISAFSSAAKTPYEQEVVRLAAGTLVRNALALDNAKLLERGLALLKNGGAHESLAKGLAAARAANHRLTLEELQRFLSAPSIPPRLRRYQDAARILRGRAHYSLGQFEEAAAELKAVNRSSNELAQSLSELAWAQLQAERQGEAIGTALNLQAGGLRHTFAPEAPMVMAMAMNELCQFPDSVRAIRMFQKHYQDSHEWLSAWDRKKTALYPQAVQYLKKQSNVPVRVASEWIRSPFFIARQDEINLIFDEKEAAAAVSRSGATEQRRLLTELLTFIKDFKPRLHLAKMKQKQGEELPPKIVGDLASLREQVIKLRRLQRGAPVWHLIMNNSQKQGTQIEASLVAQINRELETRSERMLAQLEEVAENMQLVEVEIYNGASHDIIWQNSHPDYKKVAEKFSDEKPEEKGWNWGRSVASDIEGGEIWEDELGSFKAKLFDNCSSKDRYLALKVKRGGERK